LRIMRRWLIFFSLVLINLSTWSQSFAQVPGAPQNFRVGSTQSSPGQYQWVMTIAGTASDGGQALAVDANNNILMSGITDNGVPFIAKYSPTGTRIWLQSFQAYGQTGGVAIDSSGNVVVTGWYLGNANFG